jgi:hypothetical protein
LIKQATTSSANGKAYNHNGIFEEKQQQGWLTEKFS